MKIHKIDIAIYNKKHHILGVKSIEIPAIKNEEFINVPVRSKYGIDFLVNTIKVK